MMAKRGKKTEVSCRPEPEYDGLLMGICELLDRARRMSARIANNIITATQDQRINNCRKVLSTPASLPGR
jgi:hypothetical protein